MKFFNRVQSEDLPHSSGIKTQRHSHKYAHRLKVGRLAPLIGD